MDDGLSGYNLVLSLHADKKFVPQALPVAWIKVFLPGCTGRHAATPDPDHVVM